MQLVRQPEPLLRKTQRCNIVPRPSPDTWPGARPARALLSHQLEECALSRTELRWIAHFGYLPRNGHEDQMPYRRSTVSQQIP
jgi:hypothetical protein